jgi:hypothetical protein
VRAPGWGKNLITEIVMSEIVTQLVKIDPEKAKIYLANNRDNRIVKASTVSKYADDMKNGFWQKSHQGIAFFEDGMLADGQHRLHAIIESGATIEMMVTNGLTRESGFAIDRNAPRTAADAIKIADSSTWIDKKATEVAVVLFKIKEYIKNPNKFRLSFGNATASQLHELAEKNKQSIMFAMKICATKKPYVTTAPIIANYALAYSHGENRILLARFAEIMIAGDKKDHESNAASKFRDYCIFGKKEYDGPQDSVSHRADGFYVFMRKGQNAIRHFCNKFNLSSLVAPSSFIYKTINE